MDNNTKETLAVPATAEDLAWIDSYKEIVFLKSKKTGSLTYMHPGSLFNQWSDYYIFNSATRCWEDPKTKEGE